MLYVGKFCSFILHTFFGSRWVKFLQKHVVASVSVHAWGPTGRCCSSWCSTQESHKDRFYMCSSWTTVRKWCSLSSFVPPSIFPLHECMRACMETTLLQGVVCMCEQLHSSSQSVCVCGGVPPTPGELKTPPSLFSDGGNVWLRNIAPIWGVC